MIPYAVVLYHLYNQGARVEKLAAETGIPTIRIRQRLAPLPIENDVMQEQLSYLASHACPMCPQCSEYTRLILVRELLLAPFKEIAPPLKTMHQHLACEERWPPPAWLRPEKRSC